MGAMRRRGRMKVWRFVLRNGHLIEGVVAGQAEFWRPNPRPAGALGAEGPEPDRAPQAANRQAVSLGETELTGTFEQNANCLMRPVLSACPVGSVGCPTGFLSVDWQSSNANRMAVGRDGGASLKRIRNAPRLARSIAPVQWRAAIGSEEKPRMASWRRIAPNGRENHGPA